MKRCAALAVSLVALAGVVSCGGGGDDVVGAPAGPSAEGYYAGSLNVTAFPAQPGNPQLPNTSTAFQMLVLEGGQFWTIYGTPNGTSLDVEGFAQGTGTSNGSVFIAGDVRYFSANPVTSAVASASYNASAKSISGTITDASTTATFNSAALPSPSYNYAVATVPGSIEGSWTVEGLLGDQYTLAVAVGGSFTATPIAPANCSFSGNFAPRSSGKNVFDVSLINGSAPCSNAGLPSSGIAYVSPLLGGGAQLTFATVSSSPSSGVVLSGVRP